MSLYKKLFKENEELNNKVLEILGIEREKLLRYRDVFIDNENIYILTRIQRYKKCYIPAYEYLESNKYYIDEKILGEDNTYTYQLFNIPEDKKEELAKLLEENDSLKLKIVDDMLDTTTNSPNEEQRAFQFETAERLQELVKHLIENDETFGGMFDDDMLEVNLKNDNILIL